jgi:thioredoxin reductase (NADPH)
MGRAYSQAQKFGVEMAIPDEAISLECGNDPCRLTLANGEKVQARAVVIATGARYRRLTVDRLHEFEGTSVHYWASPLEADLCAGAEVILVGGGNSAGQATVFLAGMARKVTMVVRRPLATTMSQYLIERIEGLANVEVIVGPEIAALAGAEGNLKEVLLRDPRSREEVRLPATHLFSFIGAEPNTNWLAGTGLKLDSRGFLQTGDDAGDERFPLGTSRRGIFAVGDVRSGSVKRVAAAVGDGAQVVAAIHQYLAAVAEAPASSPRITIPA